MVNISTLSHVCILLILIFFIILNNAYKKHIDLSCKLKVADEFSLEPYFGCVLHSPHDGQCLVVLVAGPFSFTVGYTLCVVHENTT